MLSRVADSIYWMQRYRERAENISRLIDVNLFLTIDAPGDELQQWEPIVRTTGDYGLFASLYDKPTKTSVLEFLTFDERNPNSILNCVHRSRENARSIREAITSEMWNELNLLYLYVRGASRSERRETQELFEFYNQIRRSCQLFTGIMDTTLSHDEGWHFGRIGNLIERSDQSSRILDVKYFILLPSVEHVGTAYDDILWAALLKSVSGLDVYRKSWHEIHHAHVIDFIVLDPEFPRSIHSCLRRARESLLKLNSAGADGPKDPPLGHVEQLCKQLESTTVYDIVKQGLHEFLDTMQFRIAEINNSMYTAYFAPLPAPVGPGDGGAVVAASQRTE